MRRADRASRAIPSADTEGPRPAQGRATYVVLILLGAGWTLLDLVFAQRLPINA